MPIPTSVSVEIDGAKVRELRQLNGQTQLMLAAASKISGPYVSLIEAGERPTVSPPVFVRICDALGIPADQRRSMLRAKAAA